MEATQFKVVISSHRDRWCTDVVAVEEQPSDMRNLRRRREELGNEPVGCSLSRAVDYLRPTEYERDEGVGQDIDLLVSAMWKRDVVTALDQDDLGIGRSYGHVECL